MSSHCYQKSLVSFFLAIGGLFIMASITYAQTCFTRQQVSSDARCLYVMNNKVYEKGSRSEPHQGHPCGTDVTSMIPVTHQMNIPTYLTPNYKGDICIAPTPTRVPTPTIKPSPTPFPTVTPLPTVIPPTVTPIPNVVIVATPTSVPPTTNLPILTALDAASGDMTSYEAQFRISYQSLLSCYGAKISSPTCTDKVSGDINNDGAINEVDYNLILIGFNKIDQKKVFITPTPLPTTEPTAAPTTSVSLLPVKKPLALEPTKVPLPTTTPTPVIVKPTTSPLVEQGLAVSKASAYGGIISIPAAIAAGVNGALKKRKKKRKV